MRAQTAKASSFPSYYHEKFRILFFSEKAEENERKVVQTTFFKNKFTVIFPRLRRSFKLEKCPVENVKPKIELIMMKRRMRSQLKL
jgi:hypothetical protein